MLDLPKGKQGVLPDWMIRAAIEAGHVVATTPIPDENVQPASLDLRLGPVAHRLRCSFLPDKRPVESKLKDLQIGPPLDLSQGGVLERNRPYLIPLLEELDLPRPLHARANPKSSTGRLDVFTRVITDRSYMFDEIRRGYRGRLYLEVVPRSFTVEVREGLALNQLRLFAGNARITDQELRELNRATPVLFRRDEPVPVSDFAVKNGLFLSLDLLTDRQAPAGYRAKTSSSLLDMTQVRAYEAADFWDALYPEPGNRVILEPEVFYLLLSEESVTIPPHLAAEMTAFDPMSGELRTHYAGFFDPGFGFGESGLRRGSRATLEVRAHDVPFMVEHRQRVCKLVFERMLEEPKRAYGHELGSNYQSQQVTLSKHFRFDRPDPFRQQTLV